MVNGDSNGLGPLSAETSLAELGEREALPKSLLHIIAESLSSHNGLQPAKGPGVQAGGLGLSPSKSPCLAAGLVEPGADADSHPVLPEMDVRKCVVVSNHCLVISFKIQKLYKFQRSATRTQGFCS